MSSPLPRRVGDGTHRLWPLVLVSASGDNGHDGISVADAATTGGVSALSTEAANTTPLTKQG